MPKLGINPIVLLHAGQSDVDMRILSGMEPACEVDPCPWVRSNFRPSRSSDSKRRNRCMKETCFHLDLASFGYQ